MEQQRSSASVDEQTYSHTHVHLPQIRTPDTKFRRLLQLLGKWCTKGSILVFTNTQQKCDQLYSDLTKAGYVALSLHGGMDQFDRDHTVLDFKNGLKTIMVRNTCNATATQSHTSNNKPLTSTHLPCCIRWRRQ